MAVIARTKDISRIKRRQSVLSVRQMTLTDKPFGNSVPTKCRNA